MMLFLDNFHRADSATVGNGWIAARNLFSISANQLHIGTTDGGAFAPPLPALLYRPLSEQTDECWVEYTNAVTGNIALTTRVGVDTSTGNVTGHYMAAYNAGNHKFYLYRLNGGSVSTLIGGDDSDVPITGQPALRIHIKPENITGGVRLTVVFTDTTTSTVLKTLVSDDTDGSAHTSVGTAGILNWDGTGNTATAFGAGAPGATDGGTTSPDKQFEACGDSLTQGEGASGGIGSAIPDAGYNAYPSSLSRLLGNTWHGTNRGIGGATLPQMETQVTDAIAAYDPTTYPAGRVLLLFGGTNDIGYDSTTVNLTDAQVAALVLQRYSDRATVARSAGYKVVVGTIRPAAHPVYENALGVGKFNVRRNLTNTLLRANWQNFADAFVDLAADPRIGPDSACTNALYYQASDKTHMTDAGYVVQAQLVAPVVATLVGQTLPRVAPPTISNATVPGDTVTLSTATAGAILYYSVNGSLVESGTEIVLNDPGTYKISVVASKDGIVDSALTTKTVTIAVPGAGGGFTDADRATLAAIRAKTDLLPDDIATSILDAVAIDGKSVRQALRIIAASVAGKLSGAAGNTITIKGLDGTTTRIVVTCDADGNRTAVTYP